MSQPANDEFSQHLSDEKHQTMKMHQTLVLHLNNNNNKQVIPQTTLSTNIKLPNSEEGKKNFHWKDVLFEYFPPVNAARTFKQLKKRKAKEYLVAVPFPRNI
ncbi:hypothetical protein Tco_0666331 [Tanacetum coccineum]